MRYTPLVPLMGSIAFSIGNNHHLNLHSGHHSRALDTMASGYDKHPKGNFATADDVSPVPQILGNVLMTKDECNNGKVDCSESQCDHCGSFCVKGTRCTRNDCVGEPYVFLSRT